MFHSLLCRLSSLSLFSSSSVSLDIYTILYSVFAAVVCAMSISDFMLLFLSIPCKSM